MLMEGLNRAIDQVTPTFSWSCVETWPCPGLKPPPDGGPPEIPGPCRTNTQFSGVMTENIHICLISNHSDWLGYCDLYKYTSHVIIVHVIQDERKQTAKLNTKYRRPKFKYRNKKKSQNLYDDTKLPRQATKQKKTVTAGFTGLAGGGAFGPMLWGTGPCIPPPMGTRWLVPDPRASIALGSRPAETYTTRWTLWTVFF